MTNVMRYRNRITTGMNFIFRRSSLYYKYCFCKSILKTSVNKSGCQMSPATAF